MYRSLALVALIAAPVAAEPISLRFERPTTPAVRPLVLTAAADPGGNADVTLPLPAAPQRERTVFGLPRNVGTVDRIIRVAVGATLVGLGAWGLSSDEHLGDTASYVLMGASAIPFATAATGYCPLYQALGIDTAR